MPVPVSVGSIDIDGIGTFNEEEVSTVNKKWLAETIAGETKEAKRRFTLYRGTHEPLELKGRTVIVVDDGIATGLTVKAAIQYAKKMGAEKVVVASPVASKDTAEELSRITETRILTISPLFSAVGQFYKNFPQVSDEEVISILAGTTLVTPSPTTPTRGILIDKLAKRILQAITYSNMIKNTYIWGIIGVLVIAGVVWWVITGNTTPALVVETKVVETEAVSSMTTEAKTSMVTYTDDGFSPTELTVKAGTTVTFTNQSSAPMWVASGAHPTHMMYPEFDAKASVSKGDSYSFTFNKIGTHSYHNHVLLGKYGKIIVE